MHDDTRHAPTGDDRATWDATEHPDDMRDDDVITHTQVTVPTEVTVVMTHGELTRTLVLRCGDVRLIGEATPDDPIHRPGSPMQFNMEEVEVVREIILDRLSGEKTTTEGETYENKQRREQRERAEKLDPFLYYWEPRSHRGYYGW